MLKLLFALVLFLQDAPAAITAPQSGEILRGQVSITGNINVPNFASAELAFAYASDTTSTWFIIQTFSSPIDSPLAVWDTTKLTDGDYTLRLRVTLQDGAVLEVLVPDLKIRNAEPTATLTPTLTPESTFTPEPVAAEATQFRPGIIPVTALPTYPTPTDLPANPATLTTPSIYSSLGRGTAATLVLALLVGLILRLRAAR